MVHSKIILGWSLTAFVMPCTACFDAVYAPVPGIESKEFTEQQLTIEPLCTGLPGSLLLVSLQYLETNNGQLTLPYRLASSFGE